MVDVIPGTHPHGTLYYSNAYSDTLAYILACSLHLSIAALDLTLYIQHSGSIMRLLWLVLLPQFNLRQSLAFCLFSNTTVTDALHHD